MRQVGHDPAKPSKTKTDDTALLVAHRKINSDDDEEEDEDDEDEDEDERFGHYLIGLISLQRRSRGVSAFESLSLSSMGSYTSCKTP